MPNWVTNVIYADRDTLSKILVMMRDKNEDNQNREFSFNALIPEPEHENEDDWYEWRIANWGVKWDASDVNRQVEKIPQPIIFDTPWSPPELVLLELSRRLGDRLMVIGIAEESNEFCGALAYRNGKVVKEVMKGYMYGDGDTYLDPYEEAEKLYKEMKE